MKKLNTISILFLILSFFNFVLEWHFGPSISLSILFNGQIDWGLEGCNHTN